MTQPNGEEQKKKRKEKKVEEEERAEKKRMRENMRSQHRWSGVKRRLQQTR